MIEGERQSSQVIVYTDGSTDVKGNPANSGSGIYVTDSNHNHLWSGGMVVRSDGNNFIAEMAAAAVAIKACPLDLNMILRIDSTATIGAISKGQVSERKRVRAAGRAWLYLCRPEFYRKEKISPLNIFVHTKISLHPNRSGTITRTN